MSDVITFTKFTNRAASFKTVHTATLEQITNAVLAVSAPSKDRLPWIKGATFGDLKTERGSLRHDANVLTVTMIEGDYDALEVSPQTAVALLDLAGIRALVYTSPSYRPDRWKWRVLCPLSRPHAPADRKALVARLNGALGGILSRESFVTSQAFFYGRVGDNPHHAAWLVDGTCIDLIDGLLEVGPATPIDVPHIKIAAGAGASSEVGQHALREACAAFASPDVQGERHHVLRAATLHVAPYVLAEKLDEAEAVAALRDACTESGREPFPNEIEDLIDGALKIATPYSEPTDGTEFDGLEASNALELLEAAEPVAPIATAADLIFDRDNPMEIARYFVDRCFTRGADRTLHYHRDEWRRWTGTHYCEVAAGEVRSSLYLFLEPARARTRNGTAEPFKPDTHTVNKTLDALATVCRLPSIDDAPLWIGVPDTSAAEVIACVNGLLQVPTRRLMLHTPRFFGLHAAPYDYDVAAEAPEWHRFLASLWPDDQQSIDTLQELFGLLLTSNTRHQKIFFLVGPKRSGKGTIARTLTALVGAQSVVAPTLASFRTNFGLQPLIGKSIAIIGDARLGRAANEADIVERLLSISGEDSLTIDRKYRDPWSGRLPTRIVMLSNELPRLSDASGALASRFIMLRTNESFIGREDQSLEAKLSAELPGILCWSLNGLERLSARGRFVQPASGQAELDALEDLGSPVSAFVREVCTVADDASVSVDALYAEWQAWCHSNGQTHPSTKPMFSRDLHTAVPGCATSRPRSDDPRRPRTFTGIKLADGSSLTSDAALQALLT